MAGYLSPAAYLYVEEQEYLQAYEDVLERYKGMWSPVLRLRGGVGTHQPGNRYLCLTRATTAWAQVNRCLDQSGNGPGFFGWDLVTSTQRVMGVGDGPETPLDRLWSGGRGLVSSTLHFLSLVEALKYYA